MTKMVNVETRTVNNKADIMCDSVNEQLKEYVLQTMKNNEKLYPGPEQKTTVICNEFRNHTTV
jgi:hypothetical protein